MGKIELTEQDEIMIESAYQDWPDPEPVKASLLPVEQLPPDILPDPLRGWITDVSHRMQIKADIVAAGAMVSVGAVIGSGCGIRPKKKDSWMVTPNLWGAAVSDPGTLKTPALQEAIGPIMKMESEAKARFDDEATYHEAEREAFKAQKEGIKSQMQAAAKGKGGTDIDSLKMQLMELQEPEEPNWIRYKTNDATIEKMAELLERNPRGILLFRDELTGLLSSWDKEGREADRAFYLEAWNGYGSITTDRIGRGTVHVNNLCVSILGGIQPAKLLSYLYQATSALDNDGLIQRMQMMVYPDKPGKWELVDEEPDAPAKGRAFNAIKTIADMDFTGQGATDSDIPYFHFNSEGQEVFYQWLQELQDKLQVDENPVILEHLAKYRSLMPSIALIDHIINIADGQQGGPVPVQSVERAAAWCDYLESHARRIYGLVGNVGQRSAVELSKKLKSKKLQNGFALRDVYRNGWYLLNSKESVRKACDELEELDWLKSYISGEGKTRTVYLINPKIYDISRG